MHASAGIAKAMERFGEAENGEAEEGLARPAHPEGWAGGLFALRVPRRGDWRLRCSEAERLLASCNPMETCAGFCSTLYPNSNMFLNS